MTTIIHQTVEFKICPTQNPHPWDEIPLLFFLDLKGNTYENLSLQTQKQAQKIANALIYFDVRWNWKNNAIGSYAQYEPK